MSKQLTQVIKKMSTRDNPTVNKELAEKVGSNMADSSDHVIVAQGLLVTGASVSLNNSILKEGKAEDARVAATAAKLKQNGTSAGVFNAQAVIVQQNNPGNTELYTALGYELTAATAEDAKEPGQVENGTMKQGDYLGTSDVHYDTMGDDVTFTVEITKGDPADPSSYVPVTMPEPVFTKSSITIVLPAGYSGNTIWLKVTAHNTAGAGPPSQPFGGKKIN
jgi:hypothetical protein